MRDVDALLWLIVNNEIGDAPTKTTRHGNHVEILVAIGDDNTAHVTMTQEAYDELQRINNAKILEAHNRNPLGNPRNR